MNSIRLALMVCFLGLLAVALLTASLLVYRNAEQTLESKQHAMGQLIERNTASAARTRTRGWTKRFGSRRKRWLTWFNFSSTGRGLKKCNRSFSLA